MPLTQTDIDQAIPGPKPYKLGAGGGLYLLVNPNGSKYWRLKYRFAGKENSLSLGVYPKTTIEQARAGREAAKALLAQGHDPTEAKRASKALEHAERPAADTAPRLSIGVSGDVEIWKGRAVVRLTTPEARQVHVLLSRILGDIPHAPD